MRVAVEEKVGNRSEIREVKEGKAEEKRTKTQRERGDAELKIRREREIVERKERRFGSKVGDGTGPSRMEIWSKIRVLVGWENERQREDDVEE